MLAQLLAQGFQVAPGLQGPLTQMSPIQVGLSHPSILQQSWQAPYPPPEAVERYEKLLPGFLNRIVSMAERVEAAQIEQSAAAITFQHNATRRGQWLGFAVAIAALFGAAYCGYLGQPWLAACFVAVPVMGVATALVNSASKGRSGTQGEQQARNASSPTAANSPSTGGLPGAPAQR